MALNIANATKYLDRHTEKVPTGKCAAHVRAALEAGGVTINPHPVYACQYGPALVQNGFTSLEMKAYIAAAGDVVVIQPYPAGKDSKGKAYKGSDEAGHIAMFDGKKWVSDFIQRDMLGGPGYRKHATSYAVYRP